jgi:predicted metalloprotease
MQLGLRRKLASFMRRRSAPALLVLLTVAVLAAGCDSGADSSGPGSSPAPPDTSSSTVPAGGSDPGAYDCATSDALAGRCSLNHSDPESAVELSAIANLELARTRGVIPTFQGYAQTDTMEGYLTTVLNHVAQYWTAVYRANGYPDAESAVSYRWVRQGESFTTGCGNPDGTPSIVDADSAASYCPADDTVYLGVPLMIRDWNGWADPDGAPKPRLGEFGVVWTIAHEYAHNLQDETTVDPDVPTKSRELEADCLAGVYLKGALNLDNQVNEQAVIEVITTTSHFGGDPDHGSSLDRMLAVIRGLNQASPAACAVEYEKTNP